MSVIVTGGAGFIGSNFIHEWMKTNSTALVNLDKLTYAGNRGNLKSVEGHENYSFIHGDIKDRNIIDDMLQRFKPSAVVHFAAESHVDRSIHGPAAFIETNVLGSFQLIDATYQYWKELDDHLKSNFRFIHVSTDEVYGSLEPDDPAFNEEHKYAPNSPYSASKASSDHLARAYFHTYGLPTIITNCSNNYGPYQFPEKLIPLVINNALSEKTLPIYGDGQQIRDWLYVTDHCSAILKVLEKGKPGEVYNIGGNNELTNLVIVETICDLLDQLKPRSNGARYNELITFVKDRPGHDRRYAIDNTKIERELGWIPSESFETGLKKTISWYLENSSWVENITSGEYRNWISKQYS